ncbi:hypothetical protein M4I21_15975 [Cellulophaga sp. 20_2_10]|uniref:hypothetical protein n=1 Tax=Cellulophaga sp. 20_2_10 TaxID=2942476 RepID=UPI00201B328F|nr:hypothetical protein [Cellulophaga sp. 20_2_10]MCL5247321.1 hypothetical protein [Cellulophaga sp. 20_2_10]
MNNNFYFCLILLIIFSCENKPKEEVFFKKDLNYHLSTNLKELDNSVGIEEKLTDDVYLRGFAFYEKGKDSYDLILEFQDDITSEIVSKYTFAVEGFVSEDYLENLSDYATSRNRKYEIWIGTYKLRKTNNYCYLVIGIKTKIKKFNLIKFYLYDQAGYKGDIGKRVLFYNYNIY